VRRSAGLGYALVSAAAFGSSGAVASTLLATGWTAGAAVLARVVVAVVALTLPAVLQLRGRWGLVRRNAGSVLGYGVVAVGGAQLCYFNAVEHLPVAVALLLEYSGVLLDVGWLWLRHGTRPRRLTVTGAVLVGAGLTLVLHLYDAAGVDLVGVLWGLGAAVGLAVYFVLSAATEETLPPLAAAWSGLLVGAVALGVLAAVGALPVTGSRSDVTVRGLQLPWYAPVLVIGLVAAAVAYVTGVAGVRRLGAKVASFVGLTEVLFAAVFAWAVLGQALDLAQLAGAVLVVAGIAAVKIDERTEEAVAVATDPVAAPVGADRSDARVGRRA
jgi:drug/metabolite transporter (DMT)-like permease